MIYMFCLYHFSLKCIIKNLYLFSDLNSLVLVDLCIYWRLLQNTPQFYVVVIYHWIIELSLQVINASIIHTQHAAQVMRMFMLSMELARLLNEGLQELRVCYTWRPGSDWLAGTLNRAVFRGVSHWRLRHPTRQISVCIIQLFDEWDR